MVWYELTDSSTTVVILEEQSGILRLNESLDELQGRVSPVFTATAFDNRGQNPSLKSTNVAIRVCVCEGLGMGGGYDYLTKCMYCLRRLCQ